MKENNEKIDIKRGEIYFADLGDLGIGSEQKGKRPVLVIQNDTGNTYSTTTIVAVITKQEKNNLPVHYKINKEISNLPENSLILLEQIKTISKCRLKEKVSQLPKEVMNNIDKKIKISLGLK